MPNDYGAGTLLYEGMYLSDKLQTAVIKGALEKAGLTNPDQQLPVAVHVQHGVNRLGKRLHYYFNYSSAEVKVSYAYSAGTNLLDGKTISQTALFALAPWDLAIFEE
jgi:beta-galactosidase